MITDKLHTGTAAGGISIATFAGECLQVVTDLRWLIILAIILIAGDFWWGWRVCISKFSPFKYDGRNVIPILSKMLDTFEPSNT